MRGAQRGVNVGKEEILENHRHDGEGLLYDVLGTSSKAGQHVAQGPVGGGGVAREIQALVHRAHGGEVQPHAFVGLKALSHPKPDRIQAQLVTREREPLDISDVTKLKVGFLFRIEGTGHPGGPCMGLKDA